MNWERKDWLLLAVALTGPAAQISGFTSKEISLAMWVAVALTLVLFIRGREPHMPDPVVERLNEQEIKEQKKQAIVEELRKLIGRSNRPSALFISAGNEQEYGAAVIIYTDWVTEVTEYIRAQISVAEAEAFQFTGNLLSMAIIVQNPLKNPYRWNDKERYIYRLDVYRERLTGLMVKVERG